MSSTAPTITEGREDPLVENERGMTGARRFSIEAASQMDARRLLRQKKQIFYGVPWRSAYGEKYDDRAVARELIFRKRTPAPAGGKGLFDALVRYGRRDADEAVPFGRPIYRKGVSLEQRKADLDADGDPIVNSVGEPFDPGFTRPEPTEMGTFTWWWMNVTEDAWAQSTRNYDGALNTVTFRGAPPLSLLCHGVTNVEDQVLNDDVSPPILAIKTEAILEYRPLVDPAALAADIVDKDGNAVGADFSGFAETGVDRGFRKKVGVDGDGKPIFENIQPQNGAGLNQPAFLDGQGNVLNDAANTVAIMYLLNARRADFNQLIPQS